MKHNSKKLNTSDQKLSIINTVLLAFLEESKDFALFLINPYNSDSSYSVRFGYNYPSTPRFLKSSQCYGAIRGLKKKKFVTQVQYKGKTLYRLTEEGKIEAQKQLIKLRISNKKSDGKWRVVVFDIPESKRILRDHFRRLLKDLGFKMLQASVWAIPYDVFDELEMMIPDIKKHAWIKLLSVDVIVGESEFNKLFNLK